MISLLATLLVLCLIFAVAWWILTLIPMAPPIANVVRVIVAVIMLLMLIYFLSPLLGGVHPLLRR